MCILGALILMALGLMTKWFYFIPSAALAAVIISAVLPMCDFIVLKHFWKIKSKKFLINFVHQNFKTLLQIIEAFVALLTILFQNLTWCHG